MKVIVLAAPVGRLGQGAGEELVLGDGDGAGGVELGLGLGEGVGVGLGVPDGVGEGEGVRAGVDGAGPPGPTFCGTLNGFLGVPGLDPPSNVIATKKPSTPAPATPPAIRTPLTKRSLLRSVRRRRSSSSLRSARVLSQAMYGEAAYADP